MEPKKFCSQPFLPQQLPLWFGLSSFHWLLFCLFFFFFYLASSFLLFKAVALATVTKAPPSGGGVRAPLTSFSQGGGRLWGQ